MEEERKLKRQGIKIDESYQDPLPKIYTDYLKNKGKNTDSNISNGNKSNKDKAINTDKKRSDKNQNTLASVKPHH